LPHRILAKGYNNDTVLEIEQLSKESASRLDHNIAAEIEANAPDAVFRIRGDFMMGKMHVAVDNEKLSIGRDSYASAAITGENGLKFTPSGLVV
jgi:hypothetical protein